MKIFRKFRALVLIFAVMAMVMGSTVLLTPNTAQSSYRCCGWCMYCTIDEPGYCWCACCHWCK
jgi:hypothetical protein